MLLREQASLRAGCLNWDLDQDSQQELFSRLGCYTQCPAARAGWAAKTWVAAVWVTRACVQEGDNSPSAVTQISRHILAGRDDQPEWLRAEELAHSGCPERVAEFDAAGLPAHCSGWRAASQSQAAGVAALRSSSLKVNACRNEIRPLGF